MVVVAGGGSKLELESMVSSHVPMSAGLKWMVSDERW